MKRFSLSAFFIGIGLGMIFSYFYVTSKEVEVNPELIINKLPNEIVIQRAKELGLIDPLTGVDIESLENNAREK
ncbi:MAG: hypothetical protein GX375_06050 [Clostridiales bacterium]|nr:hypothetical protein [Clostridiales bacterium]